MKAGRQQHTHQHTHTQSEKIRRRLVPQRRLLARRRGRDLRTALFQSQSDVGRVSQWMNESQQTPNIGVVN